MTEQAPVYILFFCVICLFIINLLLIYELNHAKKLNEIPKQKIQSFENLNDISFVCISLEKRKSSHFDILKNRLNEEGFFLEWKKGLDGKKLFDDQNWKTKHIPLTKLYIDFFENNMKEFKEKKTERDYRGHFGCTLTHFDIIKNMNLPTVVFEDDVELVEGFRTKFQQALLNVEKLDPSWEILLLGWACKYKDHFYCKDNDCEPIQMGNLVRVHYWFGGWGYMIKNKQVAEKIIKLLTPLNWHIDLSLAELARTNKLNVYGCLPTIANHAGLLRISSFDYNQVGNVKLLKSDTNK